MAIARPLDSQSRDIESVCVWCVIGRVREGSVPGGAQALRSASEAEGLRAQLLAAGAAAAEAMAVQAALAARLQASSDSLLLQAIPPPPPPAHEVKSCRVCRRHL